MQIIAHRCTDADLPEATIASARRALAAGADYLEIDVRFTRSSSPVVVHDATLQRLFGVDKTVGEIDDEAYRALRFSSGNPGRPQFLEDFLRAGLSPLVLHIKEGGEKLSATIGLLRQWRYTDRVVLGVGSLEDLGIAKETDRSLRILAFLPAFESWMEFVRQGADVVRLWDSWTTSERVSAIHDHGKPVWVMAGAPRQSSVGVASADRLLQLRDWGVDGVLVNDVAMAASLGARRPATSPRSCRRSECSR